MEQVNAFLKQVSDFVWGIPLIVLILATGIYLTIRLKGVQFRHLGKALRFMFKNEEDGSGEVSSFGALCTALSATIGTGNIVGVATALVAGGPGALFWMWMAAFFGMATKYAEGVLAIRYRTIDAKGHVLGGPFYYIQNGMKLRIANLAAGSKMFSIIKILLAKGELDNTTMLILDEPETHLHPQWQNAFAEIIVLLVKELGINILLTTHSANFMLALDAYMRKYHIADKTNFYQTDMLEDGFVRYRCVNDDMGKIYEDFLQYLSEVKVLRDQYLNGIGE